jgi:pilus assembly protein Flp/PilA
MRALAVRFVKDQSGMTAPEYALLAALVAIAIIGAARLLGSQVGTTFTASRTAMKNA